SPDRPRLTRSQLKLAKDALQTIGQNKYQELFDTPNEPILKNIAIEELLAAGVTLEDFQTLANQMHADVLKDQELNKRDHPELCHVMIPGATMEILAEAGFDKYPGESVRASGNCGFGTKGILTYAKTKTALKKRTAQTAASAGYTKAGFARAQSTGYDPTTGYATSFVNSICSNLDISNLPPGLSLAGGCRYWIGPENAALAINLTYDNAAQGFYPLTKGSAQDKMRMNWLTNHCPQGTMICWDNQVKASGNTFSNAAPGDGHGPQHGHVNLKLTAPAEAVNISSRQIYGCDGVQISASDTSLPKGEAGPNNAGWYGEYLHTTFTLDAQIPQKYAERLLILATIRTGGSLNIEKNRAAFYPKNATERKKVRQQRMQSAKHIKYTGINKNPNNPNNEQQRQPSRATRRIGSFHSQSNQKN
ncbi:MAG: hypothetical protein J6W96_05570, partial [Alphaproteobacteria bacterium]|nr:hypothetical protein [Alphaproteobacteria bacterium]